MSSPFDTDAFKKLQAAWYKKLAKEDFPEAEQPDGNLKEWTSTLAKARYRPVYWEAKEEYYRLAGQFLYEHPFKSKLEECIWELHAEGISVTNITSILKTKRYKITREKVSKLLKALVETMKKQLCLPRK
jgi:hypothetical protein